jgi:hypothetical protein
MYLNLSDPSVNSILCLLLLSFAIPLNLWTMLVVLAFMFGCAFPCVLAFMFGCAFPCVLAPCCYAAVKVSYLC